VVSITLAYVLQDLILPDQPNRAVRTRMLRGVGGAACEGRSYPDLFKTIDMKGVQAKAKTIWQLIASHIFLIENMYLYDMFWHKDVF